VGAERGKKGRGQTVENFRRLTLNRRETEKGNKKKEFGKEEGEWGKEERERKKKKNIKHVSEISVVGNAERD